MPLRNLYAYSRGNQASGHQNGGSNMTELTRQGSAQSPGRRRFLAQMRALSGLVLIAAVPGVLKADEPKKYGVEGMPHGWSDDPLAFVSIGSDGIVTIVVHRVEMGQGVRTSLPLIVADELEANWSKVRVTQAPADE